MPRLIDGDALKALIIRRRKEAKTLTGIDMVMVIDDAPTIDAAPVKHGRWEEPEPEGAMMWDKRAYSQCSICKKKSYLGRVDKYCRYCGAKMDLEAQDAKEKG